MSEKQLLHEINSSREATEEIRKQVLQAKQKGYFSNTEFGRHFLSTFVPDFAKELLQTTSKTAWGRVYKYCCGISIDAGCNLIA